MNKNQGKLIVIDGTDGAGKATQTRLLVYRLKQLGYKVETLDFPQYNQKSAGLIEEYLEGKYGEADEVNPYAASCFYACDRYDASLKIKKWLQENKIVIIDRYVTSNLAHQGCKLRDPLARKNFYQWVTDLEFNIFDIPHPDLTIVLHVDAAIAQKLSQKRKAQEWLNKTRDIHEEQLDHLERAELIYLEIADHFEHIKVIECTQNNQLLRPDNISILVWQEVSELLEDANHHYQSSSLHPQTPRIMIKRLSPHARLSRTGRHDSPTLNLHAIGYHSVLPNTKTSIQTGLKIKPLEELVISLHDKEINAQAGIHVVTRKITTNFNEELEVQIANLGNDIFHIAPGQIIAELLVQKSEFPELIEDF